MISMLREMPQPLKGLYLAAIAAFVVGFAIVAIADRPDWIGYVFIPFGGLLAVAGLVLASDFRGNATSLARLL